MSRRDEEDMEATEQMIKDEIRQESRGKWSNSVKVWDWEAICNFANGLGLTTSRLKGPDSCHYKFSVDGQWSLTVNSTAECLIWLDGYTKGKEAERGEG